MARAASIISAEVKQDAERHKPFADLLHELGKAEGQLLGTLGSHGMKVVDPTGEKFDPNIHEATFETAYPGKEPGTIFHVEQKGYMLNGRVLRPAKVESTLEKLLIILGWHCKRSRVKCIKYRQ